MTNIDRLVVSIVKNKAWIHTRGSDVFSFPFLFQDPMYMILCRLTRYLSTVLEDSYFSSCVLRQQPSLYRRTDRQTDILFDQINKYIKCYIITICGLETRVRTSGGRSHTGHQIVKMKISTKMAKGYYQQT